MLWFLVVALGWAMLAVTAVAVWLHWYPSHGQNAVAATSFVPWAIIAAVLGVVTLSLTRRWITLGLTVIAAVALVWTQIPLWHADAAAHGRRLVVVQSNIRLGQGDVTTLVKRVRDENADLLTVEELTPQALSRLHAAGISAELGYEYTAADSGGRGAGVFSRTAPRDGVLLDGHTLNNVRAVTAVPGVGDVTIYAVHLLAPWPDPPSRWTGELAAMRADWMSRTGPVLASGDYNSTYDHKQFRDLLTGGFADAAVQSGSGFLPTFPRDRVYPPLIGIDHVVSRGFVADSVRSFDVAGSDHRGIVVTLRAS